MNTAWTKGLKRGSDELKDLEAAYAASGVLRRRLKQMLEDLYDLETKSRIKTSDYDSPAWAYKQADAIGYARALSKIISMLDDDKKNN
ncbi:MAG: hypothetical protein [Bacteriophage sp.]|nr:MAG: hypothetical protein [Bacteriophage sp.]